MRLVEMGTAQCEGSSSSLGCGEKQQEYQVPQWSATYGRKLSTKVVQSGTSFVRLSQLVVFWVLVTQCLHDLALAFPLPTPPLTTIVLG